MKTRSPSMQNVLEAPRSFYDPQPRDGKEQRTRSGVDRIRGAATIVSSGSSAFSHHLSRKREARNKETIMDTAVQEAARARPHTPHYLEALPRTLVIVADQKSGSVENGATRIHAPGVLKWIREIAMENWPHVAAISFDGVSRLDIPRGIRWSDYPILHDLALKPVEQSAPAHSVSVLLDSTDAPPKTVYNIDLPTAVREAKTIVITLIDERKVDFDAHREGRLLARIFRFIACVRQNLPEQGVKVALVRTGRPPEIMDLASFEAMASCHMPRVRFNYSYGLNAGVILRAALRLVLPPGHPPSRGYYHTRFYNRVGPVDQESDTLSEVSAGRLFAMTDVLTLQVLFRLKRIGGIPSALEDNLKEKKVAMAICGGDYDWRGNILWHGTGRHDPFSLEHDRLIDSVRTLLRFGLVSSDDSNLSVSELGNKFLDLMHQDNEDPDVLLRWRGAADDADRASMDDWILRHFRKMKYKMAKHSRERWVGIVDTDKDLFG